jgi:hypothetical protein
VVERERVHCQSRNPALLHQPFRRLQTGKAPAASLPANFAGSPTRSPRRECMGNAAILRQAAMPFLPSSLPSSEVVPRYEIVGVLCRLVCHIEHG